MHLKQNRNSLSNSSKIQEIFLNHCRKNNIEITVNSKNSSDIQGKVVGFDQESIVIDVSGQQILLYKNGIYSIKPHEKVDFIFNDPRKRSSFDDYYPNPANIYA